MPANVRDGSVRKRAHTRLSQPRESGTLHSDPEHGAWLAVELSEWRHWLGSNQAPHAAGVWAV